MPRRWGKWFIGGPPLLYLMVFFAIVFFAPEMGGYFIEHPNFEAANPLKTPPHIAPVWYFTPFYAILRAVPSMAGSAFPGVMAMGAAVVILFFLPWIDRQEVKSIRYRGLCFKVLLFVFVADFIMLGYLGMQPTTDLYKLLAQLGTIYYFVFFAALWFIPKFEKTKPVPERVTK